MSSTCQNSAIKAREYLSGPRIFYLNFNFLNLIGGNIWDVPSQLPFPCDTFFIASVLSGTENNSAVMYFQPLNKPRNFPFNALSGQEQIFYLTRNPQVIVVGPTYYSVLKFKEKVMNPYFAFGTEIGHGGIYTIACSDDDGINIRGGLYT